MVSTRRQRYNNPDESFCVKKRRKIGKKSDNDVGAQEAEVGQVLYHKLFYAVGSAKVKIWVVKRGLYLICTTINL